MVVATLDLYERILARLPPPALRNSCNGVLQLEVDDVGARLKEAAEAFGRLKEVEAAVAQLQQDKGDRRRSASLMALIAETESVQRRLSKDLKRMGRSFSTSAASVDAVVTEEAAARRSHGKRTTVSTRSQPASGSDTDSDHGEPKPRASKDGFQGLGVNGHGHGASVPSLRSARTTEASDAQSTETVLELAQNCLRLVSDESLQLKEFQVVGIGMAKLVIQRLVQGDNQTEAAIQVTEAALDRIAKRLARQKNLNVNRTKKLVAVISEACSARPSLRSHFFRAQAQLESVLLEAKNNPEALAKLHPCVRLAREVDDLPLAEKCGRIREVMASIQSAISGGVTDTEGAGLIGVVVSAVKLVSNWVVQLPPEQLSTSIDPDASRSFCDALLSVADKNAKTSAGKGLIRLVGRLKMAVSDAETFEQRKNSDGSGVKTEAATDSGFQAGNNDTLSKSASAGDAGSESKLGTLQLAKELVYALSHLQSVKERHDRLSELVDAVEGAFPTIPDAAVMSSSSSLMYIMRQLMTWAKQQPIDPKLYPRYERFCKSATQYSYRITNASARTRFYRKVDELLRMVTSKTAGSVDAATHTQNEPMESPPSNKRARADAMASVSASNTVFEALEQVTTWQDGIFSLQQLDKVIKTIGGVLDDHRSNSAWDPRTDERVLECVEKLRKCVESIKKDDHRAKRLAILSKWGVRQHGSRSGGGKSKSSSSKGGKSSKRRKL